MEMFETFLSSIPKNRYDFVNELDIPEVSLSPYVWTEHEDCLSTSSDSLLNSPVDDSESANLSLDSSLPLSRAMTDSEIDYGWYRRLKNRNTRDPWEELRTALDAFPPDYLDSLYSFQEPPLLTSEIAYIRDRDIRYDEELRLKMERFFDEECRVFTPDDPGLYELQEALDEIDLQSLESDLNSLASIAK
ncbi:uncharacterized protein LOC114247292 [Bombyx mandarina]|uniref:Uncharacterized protein LOC114247292 n=1 Tax=Bombyx mandarina TaxID=7092 RepID=A0A6J2K4X0_BOMMA|nr:uncharacterized protein LOC114247292 [Bombyx mandarina]